MKNIPLGIGCILCMAIAVLGITIAIKCYNEDVAETKAEYKHYEVQHKKYTDSIASLPKQKVATVDEWRYFIVYYNYIDRTSDREFAGMRWFCANRYPSLDYLFKGIRKSIKVVRSGKHSICITGIQELNRQDFSDFDDNFDDKKY